MVVVILLAGLAAIIMLIFYIRKRDIEAIKRRQENYDNAEFNYLNSLSNLKNYPNDAEIKQRTLAKGRRFSEITRQYHGQDKAVTIFDELALMNDINAACAGATSLSAKTESFQTVEQRLAKLSELKEKNLINEQEYEARRQKILDQI